MDAPEDALLEEPVLPPVGLPDSFAAELEARCGNILDSGLEGTVLAAPNPGVPTYGVPVRKTLASVSRGTSEGRRWEGEPMLVAME